MKKLVSRSPIQRFKQGKVIKAESGFKTAKRHDYAKGAVKYQQDKNGRWLANYVNGPDTKQYYVAEGSTGYDRNGNHNILQNGKWVRIKGQSNQGIVDENGRIIKTESFDQRAKANGFKNRDEVKQLQRKLAFNGLYNGNIDGLWGVKTQAAFDQFNNMNYKVTANPANNSDNNKSNQRTKAVSMENGKIKVNPKELKQRTADFVTSPAVTVPTALFGPAYLSALAKGQIAHDVSHNVSNFVHRNIVTPVWNMVDPRNVAKRIINIKSSLPEAISEEDEGYSIDPSKINYSYKQGGQIIKANNGFKINGPYASQAEVDRWNKNLHKPYHFDVVPENQRMDNTQVDNTYVAPGSYNLQGVTFNRRNIRDNRNMYKTVDDYWKYLNSPEGMKSNDFQLWSNIMRTQDGALNREVFDDVMSKYGISGNLGRRDSGRLANVLNTLNEIGTNGSEARKAFINSYNKAFDEGSTPIVKNSGHDLDAKVSLTETTQPVPTTRRFAIPDYVGQFRSWVQSQPLLSRYTKQGGKLISRDPVKQFKQK